MSDVQHSEHDSARGGAEVTALRRALRLADARFAGVVEIAADAVISIDAAQRIILFNAGAEQIFGYAADEVLGQPLEILLPERFRATHRAHVEGFGAGQAHARRMGHRREISGLRKNGEEFPAEASISRFQVDDATVYSVVLRDISERKYAEDAQRFLAEAGEMLAGSLDEAVTAQGAVRLAVPTLGDACLIDLVWPGVRELAAVAAVDEALERDLTDVCRKLPRNARGDGPFARCLRERAPVILADMAEDGARGGETDWPVHAAAARLVGARSALLLPLLARDNTIGVLSLYSRRSRYGPDDLWWATEYARRVALALDNARLYEAAQRAIRARDETVAVVSHDLRNPVSAVRMLAANVVRAIDAGGAVDSVRDEVEVIREAAVQADALIQDLLDVARIEAGRLRIDPGPEDVAELVGAALDVLAPLAAERGVELRRTLGSSLPDACVDSQRIHQAISNLVGNAIKFTPGGGCVTVSAQRAGAEVLVRVVDTGPGIPPEHLPHLFDRYWQGTRPTRRGAGLGLPITKGIVEAHRGRIWVESTPGQGSTFSFTLPLRPPGGDCSPEPSLSGNP